MAKEPLSVKKMACALLFALLVLPSFSGEQVSHLASYDVSFPVVQPPRNRVASGPIAQPNATTTSMVSELQIMDGASFNITRNGTYYTVYTLFVLGQVNKTSGVHTNASLAIVDTERNVVPERIITTEGYVFADLSVELLNTSALLIGTPAGAELWDLETSHAVALGLAGHHEYEYNPLNDTFFTPEEYVIEDMGPGTVRT